MHTQSANLVNQVTNIHNEFLKEKKKKPKMTPMKQKREILYRFDIQGMILQNSIEIICSYVDLSIF